MNIDFINKLVNQRTQLTRIINDARTELAVQNTGMTWDTCESLVQNGANDVCFNTDYTQVVFPHSLVIVCTNDGGSIHNKKQVINNRDVVKFLSYCHKNEICIEIKPNGIGYTWIIFTGRYREKSTEEMIKYKEFLHATFSSIRRKN